MTPDSIRLHAFISHAGIVSRRKAEALIRQGSVTVNGKIASIGQRINPAVDVVAVNGKNIGKSPPKNVYYLVYKPVGYVSTASDELSRPVVVDLVGAADARLFPVGRLDLDSEGLMLLTNDGPLAYRLTHPKFQVPKTYHVLVSSPPSKKALFALKNGVKLKQKLAKAQEVTRLKNEADHQWLEIILTQGLNRQIRRMIKAINLEVIRLVRVSLGPWHIKQLKGQKYITLTHDAIYQDLRNFPKNISRDAQPA